MVLQKRNIEEPKEEVKEEVKERGIINPILSEAKTLAERIEEGNKKSEELLQRQEQLLAEQALGGKTMAGAEPEEPKEETPKDYAKKVMANEVR